MCNYYCVYLRHPGSAQAYIKFLRENALKKGVQYVLYPKLFEFPKVFQDALFGAKHPNFLCILYYGGDAAYFPKEFEWPGLIIDHLYTQQIEAEDWMARHVQKFLHMVREPERRVRRRVEEQERPIYPWTGAVTMTEENYYRELDRFNRETDEIDRLLADHKERVGIWRRQNIDAIRQANADRKRLDSTMRHWIYPGVQAEYDRWVKANPGKTPKDRREFYASLFETRLREARYHPQFKYPMDLIERLFASKPHKSPELKELIAEHERARVRLEEMRVDKDRSVEEWHKMIREDMRRKFGDQ